MLDLIPKLSLLFNAVLIPKAVLRESFRRRRFKERLRSLLREFAFLKICNEYDQGTVDIYLIDRTQQNTRDRGEAEAVAQAAQVGAAVLVDDKWGRELAINNSLEVHGTFWLLQEFYRLELLTRDSLRTAFLVLQKGGRRLPWNDVDGYLRDIGADALTAK